jgi:tetratricopeptide (TPR) repeat protein
MSPTITPVESAEQAHALSEAVDAAAQRQDWAAVVDACRQALAHPCASHAFYLADVWTGLAEAYVLQERYDDAIAALRSAVAAGYRAWPHPDADIARLHLLAGRRQDADRLFSSLEQRTPEDTWLYQAAGLAYVDTGDDSGAVEWFTKGIELGLATGDPDGIVGQMLEGRNASLGRLGRGPDELSAKAAAFIDAWQAPPPGSWSPPPWPESEAQPTVEPTACEHCGWKPDPNDPEAGRLSADPRVSGRPMGVAFFPRDEWSRAVAQWPHLLDEMPADHFAYVRELQSRILEISEATGARLVMVPISMGGLMAFCADNGGINAGGGQARAEYAARLIQNGHGRPWPPARNEDCWCGSRQKYKACCGSVQASLA